MKAIVLSSSIFKGYNQIGGHKIKILLPLRGKPIIEHLMNKLCGCKEIESIILAVEPNIYEGVRIWKDNSYHSKPLTILRLPSSLMTKSDLLTLRFIANTLSLYEDILWLEGDIIFNFTLSEFLEYFKRLYPPMLIGISELNGQKRRRNKLCYIALGDQGKIIHFDTTTKNPKKTKINIPIYVFSSKAIKYVDEYIDKGGNRLGLRDFINWFCQKEDVFSYQLPKEWIKIEDIDSYSEAVFTF